MRTIKQPGAASDTLERKADADGKVSTAKPRCWRNDPRELRTASSSSIA